MSQPKQLPALGLALALVLPAPQGGLLAQETGGGAVAQREDEIGVPDYEIAATLTGRQVVNSLDEEIGELADIIMRGDRVTHAVISIGGFLGLGGSDVVVPFEVLSFDGEQVVIGTIATSDQIEGLTRFDPQDFGLSE